MATKPRLPTNTINALRELMAHHQDIHAILEELLAWSQKQTDDAKRAMDHRRLAQLNELNLLLNALLLEAGQMERLTRDARRGVYRPGKYDPRELKDRGIE